MSIGAAISKRPWLLAVFVAALVSLWMLSGILTGRDSGADLKRAADVGSESRPDIPSVQVSVQTAKPITRYVSVYGRSAPARSVEIKSETDGRVQSIDADRGAQVKKGQRILQLDLRDRQARLEQSRASVTEHRTAYEAQLRLQPDGYVSDTQIAETLAKLEGAKAELTRAELDLRYREIRAPFDGVILDREVELGDFVKQGDPVVSFVDNTRIIVTGTVAEQDARYVALDMLAEAKLVTGQTVQGRVRYIAPVADQATRTFTVEVEIPNPEGTLPAGVTAELQIPGGELLAHKVSPSLLSLDATGTIGVKTVNDFSQVVFHPVEIARSETDGVWISGLPETSRIIVVGQGYVNVGLEVEAMTADADTALASEQRQ
jgi:multidrug efflux system membrane fusion protein